MITDIEDFFTQGCGRCARFATPECSTRRWSAGLAQLRQICRSVDLVETVKWGHPCYMHSGRNIVLLAAFREDFRLNFFHAALLKDPQRVLERQGPNTPHPHVIRFTKNNQVAAMRPVIESYLAEAMRYADQGTLPPKAQGELQIPDELQEAFDSDPELAAAFFGLTPGRQKSYVLNLNSAKKPETRTARIARLRDKILAGKGATER